MVFERGEKIAAAFVYIFVVSRSALSLYKYSPGDLLHPRVLSPHAVRLAQSDFARGALLSPDSSLNFCRPSKLARERGSCSGH